MSEANQMGGYRFIAKVGIVTFIFPIITVTFHRLLSIPGILLTMLLSRIAGTAEFWTKCLSIAALIPAAGGAIYLCKMIWPRKDEEAEISK